MTKCCLFNVLKQAIVAMVICPIIKADMTITGQKKIYSNQNYFTLQLACFTW